MREMIHKEFVLNVRKITNYYETLVEETKNKKTVGSTNEWILDNFYVISEQEKIIKYELQAKDILRIKSKRKKQLYDLLYTEFKKLNFHFDFDILFYNLNSYQEEHDDYFSYAEINFLFILFRLILINELSHLSEKLHQKLQKKHQAEKLITQIKIN